MAIWVVTQVSFASLSLASRPVKSRLQRLSSFTEWVDSPHTVLYLPSKAASPLGRTTARPAMPNPLQAIGLVKITTPPRLSTKYQKERIRSARFWREFHSFFVTLLLECLRLTGTQEIPFNVSRCTAACRDRVTAHGVFGCGADTGATSTSFGPSIPASTRLLLGNTSIRDESTCESMSSHLFEVAKTTKASGLVSSEVVLAYGIPDRLLQPNMCHIRHIEVLVPDPTKIRLICRELPPSRPHCNS